MAFFEEAYWITIEAEALALPQPLETGADKPDIANEAEQLNALAAGWAYKVPDWKGKQLATSRQSLIKKNITE